MPKVSEAYLEGRRDQILDAAAQCFAEGGFHATSMADIIAASGLSAGSVYRYFKSKEELIATIIDRLMETVIGALTQATQDSSPLEMIPASIAVMQHILTDQASTVRLLPQLWTEALRDEAINERTQQLYRTLLAHFAGQARQAQANGVMPAALDPQGFARVMLSLIQGFLVQRLIFKIDTTAELYLQTVRQLLGPALGTEPAQAVPAVAPE